MAIQSDMLEPNGRICWKTRVRATSPPISTTGGSSLIFSVPFSYFLFIFYLSRCTLSGSPSVSSLASLPFLSRCHRTASTRIRTSESKIFGFRHRICLKKVCFRFFYWIKNFLIWCCKTTFLILSARRPHNNTIKTENMFSTNYCQLTEKKVYLINNNLYFESQFIILNTQYLKITNISKLNNVYR